MTSLASRIMSYCFYFKIEVITLFSFRKRLAFFIYSVDIGFWLCYNQHEVLLIFVIFSKWGSI